MADSPGPIICVQCSSAQPIYGLGGCEPIQVGMFALLDFLGQAIQVAADVDELGFMIQFNRTSPFDTLIEGVIVDFRVMTGFSKSMFRCVKDKQPNTFRHFAFSNF
jgi:hypothetical protein